MFRPSQNRFLYLSRHAFSKSVLGLAIAALLFLAGCASKEEKIESLSRKADDAIFAGESEKALELLAGGVRNYSDSAKLHEAYGNALAEHGNLGEAISNLEKAIEIDPDRIELWATIGELKAQLGDNAAAAAAFETYVEQHPNDFLAWKSLSEILEKSGDIEGAIKAASTWNQLKHSAKPAYRQGQLYLGLGNSAQARSWFAQATTYENDPVARRALADLIQLETEAHQYLQAEQLLNEFESRYGSAITDERIENSRSLIDRWRKAQEELARAGKDLQEQRERLERKQAEAKRREEEAKMLREEYFSQQQASEQVPDTASEPDSQDQIETKEPSPLADTPPEQSPEVPIPSTPGSDNGESNYDRGLVAMQSGNYQAAIDAFYDALGADSTDGNIWHQLSNAYAQQKNWFDAESCILEAKRRSPRSELIAEAYLYIITNTQNTNKVLSEAKLLRELFPKSPAIALVVAQSLRDGRAPRALTREAYQNFLSIASPSNAGFEEAQRYLNSGN